MAVEPLHRCYFLSEGPMVCRCEACPVNLEHRSEFYPKVHVCVEGKKNTPDPATEQEQRQ